jgi:hypothetical protein
MSVKGRTGKSCTRVAPQDLDDMGKAELLEVQWQVGDSPSPDNTIEVRLRQQHLTDTEV